MKFCMFTSGYMRDPLEKAFRDAAELGYDGIEIWGGRPHAYAPDLAAGDLKDLVRLSRDYGVPIVGYTPETNAYPYNMMIGSERMRRDSLDYIKLSMDMAAAMGAGFTLISAAHAGYDTPKEVYWPRLLDCLRELVAHGESIGMTLCLEALTRYESNVVCTADDLAQVFREISSPRLVTMCDVCAPYVNREPVSSYFAKLGDRVRHLHLVDSDGISDTHYLPGDGNMPLGPLLRDLKRRGYDGTVTLELVTAYIHEPTCYADLALRRAKELLAD